MTTYPEERMPIQLTTDYAKGQMARTIPGAYFDTTSKAWLVDDPVPRTAAVILRLFPELASPHPELVDLRDKLLQDVRPFDNATPFNTHITAAEVYESLAKEGKEFYEFQSIDLGYLAAVLRAHKAAYCGWERGLGKTLGSCALVDSLEAERVLVVCPNTAKRSVWWAELRRWLPGHEVVVIPNDKTKRERVLREVEKRTDKFVLVVHYEVLSIIAGKKKITKSRTDLGRGWDKLGTWDIVIADEVHRTKEVKSQMTRALKRIPTHHKLALSGSIIQNHAEELFSVFQWLFPEVYKSKWRDWNDRYLDFVDGPFGKVCLGIKTDRIEEMRQELGVFMTYRRKEDELDLPPKTSQDLLVDITPGQRKVYDDLLRTCMASLPDGTVVKAADGLVVLGRLRQVASGLDLLSTGVSDSSKLDLAVEIIRDNPDEAFVVFGWYKASLHALAERLQADGIETFNVDGDVPHDVRSDYIERFQAGEAQVFLGTLATLSESVTLHRASNAIFLDRSWNPAQNVQAEDRIYRIGQSKPVTITHIIAKGTVDELRVLPTIANKEALRRLILGGL